MNARRVLIPVLMIAVCAVILVTYNLAAVNTAAPSPTPTLAVHANASPTPPAASSRQLPSSIPPVGVLAPDFSLPSAWGDQVTLSHYQGDRNVVLVFYRTSG